MARRRPTDHEKSSGNVFADLGIPHPDQELLKARLALQIHRIIKTRQLTQTQAFSRRNQLDPRNFCP